METRKSPPSNFFKFIFIIFIGCYYSVNNLAYGQFDAGFQGGVSDVFDQDDDLDIDGDIFSDFNEDIESAQVAEDERFYRYGRFFTFTIGLGLTGFDGNRGVVYENAPPSYSLSLNYFLDFRSSFGIGLAYSKHSMFFDFPTFTFEPDPIGFVDVSMLRVFFSYRYYIETANLGTAVTYSNPYFTMRLEYWYTTNKFVDQSEIPNDAGGGLGAGIGGGLEFPIKIKESYIGVELLYHRVNFFDSNTSDFAPEETNPDGPGIADLSGNAYTFFTSYVINW